MIVGNITAQNENGQFDSICVSMTTPYTAGVKWNCSCIIHNKLVSVNISEFYRSLEIPSKKIIIPIELFTVTMICPLRMMLYLLTMNLYI